ncbi:hypothetical protein DFH09DRAFT_1340847 [Mycena vulgaris]|nr:hypothetical protein DFH09DRAFT_1340847 [Mycena vulgaris]
MAKGQFTQAQNTHIQSFFPEFQTKASVILDSSLFTALDTKFSRKIWFEMIVRKFTNYRNQVYLKSPEAQASLSLLFSQEHHDTITLAAKQRGLDTKSQSPAGVYQNILKERWDALSGEEQAGWNDRAEAKVGDISQNQEEFPDTLQLALRDLCQGNFLGEAEMVLFYAFRDPENGDLLAGTIHGHSAQNQVNFGGSREELQLHYGKPWSDFAETVIPRPIILNPAIPRNASDHPVFPSIDLNSVPLADVRMLLVDYFDQCWAHRGSSAVGSIPWEEIVSNPSKYYDSEGSPFSIKLDHPQNLSTMQVLNLAEDLLATSGLYSPTPFRFLQAEEVVLIPSTPIPPSVQPPSPRTPPPPQSPPPVVNFPLSPPPQPSALLTSPPSQHTLSPSPPPPVKPTGRPKKKKTARQRDEDEEELNEPAAKKSRLRAPKSNLPSAPHVQRKSARTGKSAASTVDMGPKPRKKPAKWRGWVTVDSDGNEVDSD